ncbi:MAG: hypothetical protein OXF26_04490 [Alphaproteobacteria bacterium]|nr:hypothetical protein [Alphaproteobacteria bacterium]
MSKTRPRSQSARFIETARELEADESEDRFNKTLQRIVKPQKRERNEDSS